MVAETGDVTRGRRILGANQISRASPFALSRNVSGKMSTDNEQRGIHFPTVSAVELHSGKRRSRIPIPEVPPLGPTRSLKGVVSMDQGTQTPRFRARKILPVPHLPQNCVWCFGFELASCFSPCYIVCILLRLGKMRANLKALCYLAQRPRVLSD